MIDDIERMKERLRRDDPEGMKRDEKMFREIKESNKERVRAKIEAGDLFITHYFNEVTPRKDFLAYLPFLTTDTEGLDNYYFLAYGHYKKNSDSLKFQIEIGDLIKFPKPIKVEREGEVTFMDHNRIIYIANHEKPWGDLERKAVYNAVTGESLI
tara:strand:- start:239 stop:703 length:465 start_codon:yes stop_codon:yes gene_type:complete